MPGGAMDCPECLCPCPCPYPCSSMMCLVVMHRSKHRARALSGAPCGAVWLSVRLRHRRVRGVAPDPTIAIAIAIILDNASPATPASPLPGAQQLEGVSWEAGMGGGMGCPAVQQVGTLRLSCTASGYGDWRLARAGIPWRIVTRIGFEGIAVHRSRHCSECPVACSSTQARASILSPGPFRARARARARDWDGSRERERDCECYLEWGWDCDW